MQTGALAAEPVWQDIKPAIFGERTIRHASPANVVLEAPYRSDDDRVVPVAVRARFADGRQVRSVTVVVDENPMPVSAVFRFAEPRGAVAVAANMRFNGPSPIRAVVETDDGVLHMSEAYVKTTGLGACASPPVSDPKGEIASLGRMKLRHLPGGSGTGSNGSGLRRSARLTIEHPNLTGLQIDQISLQHIPARYIDRIEISQGGRLMMTVEGGIALSENPEIDFDYTLNGAGTISVLATDTDGTAFRQEFTIDPAS